MQIKQITEFSFWEFCVAVQDAIKQGFEFSTDNDKMPSAYVGNYNCVMVKTQNQEIPVDYEGRLLNTETQPEPVIPEVKVPQTKGRKPKTN